MAKSTITYVCQSCGTVHAKWNGKCEGCGAWNTLVEEAQSAPGGLAPQKSGAKKTKGISFSALNSETGEPPRFSTGISEFDRVLGGGAAPASAILIGGDPGIGKSTLLLQAAARMAMNGEDVVYVSGEEAVAQIQGRARRLKVDKAPVKLASETDLRSILAALKKEQPTIAIIDSVQTLWSDSIEAAPGSVGQVRACAQELTRFAKQTGCIMVLVGHVTKDGQIAGPRVMEHMVDAVFYFEGERGHQFRILRGVKNRFGPTDEIGVFEMREDGLQVAEDPSAMFLGDDTDDVAGRAVFAAMDGSRPVLAEVQALAGPNALGSPRRSVVGWDNARLAMLLAVFETRCGVAFGARDVYLSVAGGYRMSEPAGDLAAAAALASSALDISLPANHVFFGEIALSGAVRTVGRMDARLKEAARLGFSRAYTPTGAPKTVDGIDVHELSTLQDLLAALQNEG